MTTRFTASVSFDYRSDDEDVDQAETELQKIGFEVYRMPDECRVYLLHGRDGWPIEDYLEAVIAGTDADKVRAEADGIVTRFHGVCNRCSPIDQDYEPFAPWKKDE